MFLAKEEVCCWCYETKIRFTFCQFLANIVFEALSTKICVYAYYVLILNLSKSFWQCKTYIQEETVA